MNEQLSIDAPEQIELNYDIAGIVSRSFAGLIDTIFIVIISITGILVIDSISNIIVDFLPILYCVGLVSMMIDKKWRRLGDLAAGTLVIKEQKELSPKQLIPYVTQKKNIVYADIIQLDKVTNEEMTTIREYLSRRRKIPRIRKPQLARTIAIPIAKKMEIKVLIEYDLFLEEIFLLSHKD